MQTPSLVRKYPIIAEQGEHFPFSRIVLGSQIEHVSREEQVVQLANSHCLQILSLVGK